MSTGGQSMVLGASGSFIAANTELALALNMSLPILYYLAKEETRRWLRLTLYAAFALTLLAVPFTYSRGGLLGLAAVLVVLYVKARRRIMLVPVVAVGIIGFFAFAPDALLNRMRTLENVQADGSANLRLMSWQVALGIAQDSPIVGGGFRVFHHRATYDIYMPEYPRAFGHDAHSIYFNLLGEHGWVGLGLFLCLLASVLLRLRRLRALAKSRPEVAWAGNYAHMLQASLAAYLVNGATLSAAYFDLAYQLLILTPLIHAVATQQLAAPPVESAVPAVPPAAAPAPAKVG
jgi:probable O-glycosylation ligase (exosortase A-associated)